MKAVECASIFLRRPALVRQRQPFSCWAAALQSWLSVCLPGSPYDEAWAIQAFGRWQGASCRLDSAGLKVLAAVFSMRSQELGAGELTPGLLCDRLRRGHLFLAYRPHPGPVPGHVVVVYGAGDVAVDVMDPQDGYVSRPHEFFRSRTQAFLGWPWTPNGTLPDPARRVERFLETGQVLH